MPRWGTGAACHAAAAKTAAARALPLSYAPILGAAGFEPATPSLTAKYQTSSPPTRQHRTDPGNRRNLRRRRGGKRALLLSYRPSNVGPGGIRTRDLVRGNEETDFFTTGSGFVRRGTGKNEARQNASAELPPEPASRTPCRGALHGTHNVRRVGRATERLVTTYSFSSPPAMLAPRGMGGAGFLRRTPRLHHLDDRNSPLVFPMTKASERLENKNPSGALAREGFE